MDRTRVGFAALGVVGVLLAVWASYGPFFFETCCHPLVTPYSQAWRLAGYLLWTAVLLVAFWRSPAGPMWKLVLFYLVANGTWVLGYLGPSLAWTLAQYFQNLGDAVFVQVLLAFPTGRLSNRFDRIFVGVVYSQPADRPCRGRSWSRQQLRGPWMDHRHCHGQPGALRPQLAARRLGDQRGRLRGHQGRIAGQRGCPAGDDEAHREDRQRIDRV